MVSFCKEAKPDRTTQLETKLDVEQPVKAISSDPVSMGEENIHPPMGLPNHSEWEGWGATHSDSTVCPSRALDYIIPTLRETHTHMCTCAQQSAASRSLQSADSALFTDMTLFESEDNSGQTRSKTALSVVPSSTLMSRRLHQGILLSVTLMGAATGITTVSFSSTDLSYQN